MYIVRYSALVHPSPYELVPNILRCTFNNLYICPRTGADNPREIFPKEHKSSVNLVIWGTFSPFNNFVTIFPIHTTLTLPNFVELENSMLHARFQEHRTFDSGEEGLLMGFTRYGRDGYIGHVT